MSNLRRLAAFVVRLIVRIVALAVPGALIGGILVVAVGHPDLLDPQRRPLYDLVSMLDDTEPPEALAVVSGEPVAVGEDLAGPDTLGDDAQLDELWVACEGGSGLACDQLFELAPVGSTYERFGLSCGERPTVLDCQLELDGTPQPIPELPLD